MARRKRLTLPQPGDPSAPAGDDLPPVFPGDPFRSRPAPIAQVAGDASAQAALAELASEMARARQEGRLVQAIPLEAVDEGWLHRDRMRVDPEEMADLLVSIRDRGQQVPIEVVARDGGGYGLISGWRRLTALRRLAAETGDPRFATVLALLRRPETAADAYRAMVEENELRAGLSYYERARIAALAAAAGVHPDPRSAIAALFAAASKAKRSKIGSFLVIHEHLGHALRFGPAIPERLGLLLSRALSADPALAGDLVIALHREAPDSPAAEMALLDRMARRPGKTKTVSEKQESTLIAPPSAAIEQVASGISLETGIDGGTYRLTLQGPRVGPDLRRRLVAWLEAQE